MERRTLPMNLQFFAENPAGNAADPATADGTGTTNTADTSGGAGQSAADQADGKDATGEKKGSTADTKSGNLAGDVQKLVQEEMKKASMTPEEKEAYEADEREKSLKAREDAISLRERTADAKELLAENGLPATFTKMVTGKDKEETEKNVKAFKTEFDASVQAQVEKRLGGRTPEAGSGVSGGSTGSTMENTIMSYL